MSLEFRLNKAFGAATSSLDFNRNLDKTVKSLKKLSSGLKITSAADSPAGLVISEQLRSRIASLNQEINNLNNNISKYEATSTTLSGLRSLLIEARTLAVGAANEGGNSPEAQAAYGQAANDLIDNFNAAVKNTSFNGSKTLDGSAGSLAALSAVEGVDLSSAEAAAEALAILDEAIEELDTADLEVGSTVKNGFRSELASLQVERQNLVAAESQVRDISYAKEISEFIRSKMNLQVSAALLSHSGLSGKSVLNLLK